jgi:hypothetical protein
MALPSRVSELLALVSRQAAAEELIAESTADRAVQASYDVAAARSTERAAQAGVDQASDAFLPTVGVSATCTRLSDFAPSPLFPFAIVAANAPAGTVSPRSVSAGPVPIVPILDMYALDATLIVPSIDHLSRRRFSGQGPSS